MFQLQNVAGRRPPGSREKISTRRLGFLMVLLMGSICLLAASMILTTRQQVWADAARTSQNLLEAEVAGIDRILTIYDASLRSAARTAGSPLVRNVPEAVRRMAIFDDVQDTPELGPVRILDDAGAVIYDAATEAPAPATAAELRALARHRDAPDAAARLSGPFPVGAGRFALTLSHRVSAPDGGFGGIVVGTIDLNLFQKEFARLSVGAHDSVSLFSNDGVMLAHIPGDPWVGRSIAGSRLLRQFREQSTGTFVAPAALDGVWRVFSFRHVAPWSLFLDVGLSTQDLYRPWYVRTVITGVLMVAMIVSSSVMLRLLKRDLRARHLAEKDLVDSEHRYRLLAASASDVIVRVDRNTIRTYVSPSCTQFGYEPDDLVGLTSSSWVHEDDLVATRAVFLRTIDEQVEGIAHYRLRHKTGEYTWVEGHLSPIQAGGYLAVIRNVEQERQGGLEADAAHELPPRAATTDGLTGLANRRVFDETLLASWRAANDDGRPLSLILVDVDHFGAYNERHGEAAGDAVLHAVARLVEQHAARVGGLAARYAADTFAVILPMADLAGSVEMAQTIRTSVWDGSFQQAGSGAERVTVSVGAATVMPSMVGGSPEALVRAAGDALRRVKEGGRNQVQALALA